MLHIFDVDGTILDSMKAWFMLCPTFLGRRGIETPADLNMHLFNKTIDEGAEYLRERFGLSETAVEIRTEMRAWMKQQYAENVEGVPETVELIKQLHAAGDTLVILSSSDSECFPPALKRIGVLDFFDTIFTPDDLKTSKRDPEAYLTICRKYGANPADTVLYDDADYALEAAAQAGLKTRKITVK